MLRRVVRLEHVGLFHNGTPQALDLRKTTVIYGENGRGKSTFSAVMDSCSRNRPDLILNRRTIDEPAAAPAVSLIFDVGRQLVEFTNGAWNASRPDILVFDSLFVQERVHTGMQILTENRLRLYEFALGDAAQDARDIEIAGHEAREANRLSAELERTIRAHADPLDVATFRGLPQVAEAGVVIATLSEQLAAANAAQRILRRQELVALQLPNLGLDRVFAVLRRTLPDVHQDAEARVRAHLAQHARPEMEDWISRGHRFENGEDCPYCGQEVQGVGLLDAYRDFFDEGYGRLKHEIDQVRADVEQRLPTAIAIRWFEQAHYNAACQEAWGDLSPSEPIRFGDADADLDRDDLKRLLLALIERKQANPLEAIGSDEEREAARALFQAIANRLGAYNDQVTALNHRYAAKKQEIAAGDVTAIERNILRTQKAQLRHRQDVALLIDGLALAEAAATAAAARKERLRTAHDQRMVEILDRYQAAINERLRKMRAGFRIHELRGGHPAGQAPRTIYGIELRGAVLTNLELVNGAPSVPTVLSDGDRRALALAFFLARLDLDGAALANSIVVFDDPVTSFDTTRTTETIRALTELNERCRQMIVLSHDAYFLRDLSRSVGPDAGQRIEYKIGYSDHDYAVFAPCDLAEICGEAHVRGQRAIADYLAGVTHEPRPVAECLRILVEDYYKHRYPGFTHDLTILSDIIASAEAAQVTPLHSLSGLIKPLRDFNAYASRYHHSTPGYRTAVLDENRLRHYCRGALSLIHDEGRSHPLL